MIKEYGHCACGTIKVLIELPESLDKYSPRQCDCDFCLKRNISYLSHPAGSLIIENRLQLTEQRQGSNQADFLTCNQCKMVVAVSINLATSLIEKTATSTTNNITSSKAKHTPVILPTGSKKLLLGALNSNLLTNSKQLKPVTIVSPKLLGDKEKLVRWRANWLPITMS